MLLYVTHCSFSLLAQRKRTKRKGTFSKAFFDFSCFKIKNRSQIPKFSTGFRKFLTGFVHYAVEKDLVIKWYCKFLIHYSRSLVK